jgi:superfamily II DNA helicase RecQ
MMEFKTFAVSALGGDPAEEELNRYLRSHRVLAVRKEWATVDGRPYWLFCVETLAGAAVGEKNAGRRRVDYKELLSPEDFAVFVALRDLRKTIADAEAVPVFTIFTNEHLAEIARRRPASVKELGEIDGVGPARSGKYGQAVVRLLAERAACAHEELATPD